MVVEEPIPEDLQVNAINHLLGTVQELREALGELHGVSRYELNTSVQMSSGGSSWPRESW